MRNDGNVRQILVPNCTQLWGCKTQVGENETQQFGKQEYTCRKCANVQRNAMQMARVIKTCGGTKETVS